MEIAAAHKLDLPYKSKCQNLHGHGFVVTVHCGASDLNEQGMVVDFTVIKKKIHAKLDHTYLNDVEGVGWDYDDWNNKMDLNITAERLAYWICMQIPECYKVSVQESIGNVATYDSRN